MTRRTKVARIHYPEYPAGTPAPMYLKCACGSQPGAPEAGETVECACGVEYDAQGRIVASVISSYALIGIDAHPVTIRCSVRRGPTQLAVAGIRKSSVNEMGVRIRAALASVDVSLLERRFEVTISPADLNQLATPSLDLAVTCAMLRADGMTGPNGGAVDRLLVLGELGLDGRVRSARGVLAACMLARSLGMRGAIVPRSCAAEACRVDGLAIYPVSHLSEVVAHLTGECALVPLRGPARVAARGARTPDMADIRGLDLARRALEIAAAGAHRLLLVGPPGAGKTMVARRLTTILPPMTSEEEIDTLRVFSACGLSDGAMTERPLRAPHHTISHAALVGGGTKPHPGEMSLAHNGVLFLDEFHEFSDAAVATLRTRRKTVEVGSSHVTMPADFHMIASTNPCPCGWRDSGVRECTCSPGALARHSQRAEARERSLDMRVKVAPLALADLRAEPTSEASEVIRSRVVAARDLQRARLAPWGVTTNAAMSPAAIDATCEIAKDAQAVLDAAAGYACPDGADCGGPECDADSVTQRRERILRVARTIADLAGARGIAPEHVEEASALVSS